MTQGLFLLSDMAAACIRAAVCLLLISRLLSEHAKKAGRRLFPALFFGVALLAVSLSPSGVPDFYRQLPEAVLIALCAGRWLQANTRMCLFVGIYFEIAVAFWQFLPAARQVAEPQARFIRLKARRINHLLVIKVENSASCAPVQENGIYKTAKTESGLHGWGLKSARTAAEKYDGALQTAYADGVFRAVATLSFAAVSMDEPD